MIVGAIILLTLLVNLFTLQDTFKNRKGVLVFVSVASILTAIFSIWNDSKNTLQGKIDKEEIISNLKEIDTLQSTIQGLNYTLQLVLNNTTPKDEKTPIQRENLSKTLRQASKESKIPIAKINNAIRTYVVNSNDSQIKKLVLPCAPRVEVWNGLDDDCDGDIDEGLLDPCAGKVEICNDIDDDCDGLVDEFCSNKQALDIDDRPFMIYDTIQSKSPKKTVRALDIN